jgi:hypothetical protein
MNNRKLLRIVWALALVSCVAPMHLAAQSVTGRIIGRVLEASTAKPVVGAQVFVESTSIGVLTDLNGRYVLSGVPAGPAAVTVSSLGYGTKTVTGVEVSASAITTLDITLEQSAVEIQGITIDAEREQGSNAFLLDQRRTAASMVEAVGAAEISRRPDADAADVAKRLTGVTVAEGKYVFVRGLGERYSQTSLNGSSLPSPEPEREVVPLDLFPSGFLESLQTQKSYTPDLPADFSGGSVKIETKDFPNEFVVRFGTSTSFNSMSQFQDGFLRYNGGGRDWIGFDDGSRGQPSVMQDLMGGIRSGQRLPNDPNQRIQIGEALRAQSLGFAPASQSTPLNRSFDLSVGGRSDVGDDGELGFFVAGTYSDNYALRSDEQERKWRTSGFNPDLVEFATPNVDYQFVRGTRAVSWGTIGNVTYKPTPSQKISLRTTVNLSTDDEARSYEGENNEDIGGIIRSDRSRFVQRLMLWSQLSGEHQTLFESRLDWRVTVARADRSEPMMRETIYLQEPTDQRFYLLDFTESARYFFSELVDDDLSAAFDWSVPFGFFGRDASVKLGGAWRSRTRDFGARRLNWNFAGSTIQDLDSSLASGQIIDGVPRETDVFAIDEVVEPGDVYGASDDRRAGYLMVDVPVTDRLQAIVGARVEQYDLGLDSRGSELANVSQTDIAPSLNLIFSATDNVKLRGAFSQTVDRPEFRELAPFQFTEATSLRQLVGNPNLVPASITSGDLRMDWFPGPGEMISFGGFYKQMKEPIEQVFIAAASSAFSFQNAEKADVMGLELDVQLMASRISPALQNLSFQGNYSWIDSEVTVRPGQIFFPTNEQRPLEGQASYVLNLGVNYAAPSGLSAGLFLNRFGQRLTAAGGSGIPDIYEQPRNGLDATIAFDLPGQTRVKMKATNLLDAPYLFEQSANGITQMQRRYTVGRTVSVGLSWEF